MANYKDSNSKQGVFISVIPEEQLLPDSFEYAVNYLVDHDLNLNDFDEQFKNDHGGAPAYSPALLLKIILSAYARGMTSSRKIENLCRHNTVFMALSGFQTPDHSTLAAFVSGNAEWIVPLFSEVVLKCDQLGLIGKQHFAIDGVKLPSNASKKWSGTKADFKKKYQKIQTAVRRMLKRHREEDERGDVDTNVRTQELKQIEKLKTVSKKFNATLKTLDDKIGRRGKPVKSNLTDNDSAHIRTGNQGALQGYAGIAIADDQHQIICVGHATGESEQSTFKPLVKKLKSTLREIDGSQLTADAGFYGHESINYCYENNVDAYIADNGFRKRDPRFIDRGRKRPKNKQKKYFKPEDFYYEEDEKRCWCPAGKEMWISTERYRHPLTDQHYIRFVGHINDCRTCPLQKACMRTPPKAYGRQVSILLGREENPPRPLDLMKQKIDSRKGRLIYSKRIGTIEPVFAHIRSAMKLDRFSLRGQIKVNAQWLLFCMVHNIKKIQKYSDYLPQGAH